YLLSYTLYSTSLFFTTPPTPETYTLSLHDALPISGNKQGRDDRRRGRHRNYSDISAYRDATTDYSSRLGDREMNRRYYREGFEKDRKSTLLNSSHLGISYAVFCLKKKKKKNKKQYN